MSLRLQQACARSPQCGKALLPAACQTCTVVLFGLQGAVLQGAVWVQASWNAGVVTIDASAAYHEAGALPRHASVRSSPSPDLSAASRTSRRLGVSSDGACAAQDTPKPRADEPDRGGVKLRGVGVAAVAACAVRATSPCTYVNIALVAGCCADASSLRTCSGRARHALWRLCADRCALAPCFPCGRVALGSRAHCSEPAALYLLCRAGLLLVWGGAMRAVHFPLPHGAGCDRGRQAGTARHAVMNIASHASATGARLRGKISTSINRRPAWAEQIMQLDIPSGQCG